MKTLRFHYSMRISFDSEICRHRFTLKCLPQDSDRQKILGRTTNVFPNEFINGGQDSFGNRCIYGYEKNPHQEFFIAVQGTAMTGLAEFESAPDERKIGFYRYQTPVTKPGPALTDFFSRIRFGTDDSNFDRSEKIMKELSRNFSYKAGTTRIGTTSEEAFSQGFGVCQDYAHIMLSLCRMAKIPCRYVCGMLIGEGASHAWVEIYDVRRWFAFDPTNNLVVAEDHIKISCGRDYSDCSINQGVFYGNAVQTQTVNVTVEEMQIIL